MGGTKKGRVKKAKRNKKSKNRANKYLWFGGKYKRKLPVSLRITRGRIIFDYKRRTSCKWSKSPQTPLRSQGIRRSIMSHTRNCSMPRDPRCSAANTPQLLIIIPVITSQTCPMPHPPMHSYTMTRYHIEYPCRYCRILKRSLALNILPQTSTHFNPLLPL